jgi:hypothetical protein
MTGPSLWVKKWGGGDESIYDSAGQDMVLYLLNLWIPESQTTKCEKHDKLLEA